MKFVWIGQCDAAGCTADKEIIRPVVFVLLQGVKGCGRADDGSADVRVDISTELDEVDGWWIRVKAEALC